MEDLLLGSNPCLFGGEALIPDYLTNEEKLDRWGKTMHNYYIWVP